MRRSLFLPLAFVCLLLFPGCGTSLQRPDPHTISSTTTGKPIAGRTTLSMPFIIPGQSVLLVPFAIESEKDWFQTHDPYSAGGRIGTYDNSRGLTASLAEGDFAASVPAAPRPRFSQSGAWVRWHNAIFRDLKSGQEWSILDRRGVISSWSGYNLQARSDAPVISHLLLFIATLDDTNHDGLLNDLDARVAIIVDGDGRHPRIISPANAQVWAVAFDPENDRVYLQVVADTNGDGKFDYNDLPVPYVCEVNGNKAEPVVSDAALKRVEALLK